jgi:bacterioferritin-associated ferredoxin
VRFFLKHDFVAAECNAIEIITILIYTLIRNCTGVDMYVCLCNGVSDKKIRQAVRQFSPQSFQQLRKFVPVGTQCGKCIRAAREIMQDELTQLPEFKEIA